MPDLISRRQRVSSPSLVQTFRRLGVLYASTPGRVALAVGSMALAVTFGLMVPWLLKDVLDYGLAQRRVDVLYGVGGLLVLVTVLRAGAAYGQSYLSAWLAHQLAYRLRNMLYEQFQRLSFAYHDRTQTGELMSRATADVEAIRLFFQFGLPTGVHLLLTGVGTLVAVAWLDWRLLALACASVPFFLAVPLLIGHMLRPLQVHVQERTAALTVALQESLSGIRVIKAFSRERQQTQRFMDTATALYNAHVQVATREAWNFPLLTLILGLLVALALYSGGRQVIGGAMSLGTLVAAVGFLVQLAQPLRRLSWMTGMASLCQAGGERLLEILDTAPSVQEAPNAQALPHFHGAVCFAQVSFAYDSSVPVLHDVSFTVQPGQVIALVGSTGSGKSTIAQLIPRFYDVASGRITVDGIDLRTLQLRALRQHIGIVMQDAFLFSTTIRDNIAYGREDLPLDAIIAAAQAARAHDFIKQFPDGYDTWVGERGVTLSGGQRQRVAIARAFARNPRLLILDDATSSVDMETEFLIQQALSELMAGRTTFIIAQRLRTLKHADSILVLDQGRLVQCGTHAELVAQAGLYRRIYDLQLRDQEDFVTASVPIVAHPAGCLLLATPMARDEAWRMRGQPSSPPTSSPRRPPRSDEDKRYGSVYDTRVLRRLWPFMVPYSPQLMLATACMLGITGSHLLAPYLIKISLDGYMAQGNLSGLTLMASLYAGNSLFAWYLHYHQVVWLERTAQRVLLDLRQTLFQHLMRLDLGFFDRNAVGRLMSRVQNDVGTLEDFFTNGVLSTISDILTLAGIIVVMLSMQVRLTLITLTVVPLMVVLTIYWRAQSRRAFQRVRAAIAQVNAGLQENIAGVRVVQSLCSEASNMRRFEVFNYEHLDANLVASRLSALLLPSIELISVLGIALVIVFGGPMVLSEQLSAGGLVAFILYIQRFFEPIRDLGFRWNNLQMAMAAGEHIMTILDAAPQVVDKPHPVPLPTLRGEVEFRHVSFHYQPDLPVLHDLCLHIPAGQSLAIVGHTGAGKTTLVNLLARFYDVTAGSILVDGVDIRHVSQESLRQHIAMVLQEPFLFSGSIRDNIRYGNPTASDAAMVAAAQAIGVHDFIMRLEHGYDTEVRERGVLLSHGQRQLISFVRALLADPRILILDEATANIDTETERLVQAGLAALLHHRTALIIAHRLSTVKHADRIIVLDHGRLVENGTHEELLRQGGQYYRLYAMTYAGLVQE